MDYILKISERQAEIIKLALEVTTAKNLMNI